MKNLLKVFLMCFITLFAFAGQMMGQQKTITGRVVDAALNTSRTSATPLVTAFNLTKVARVVSAMMDAKVVLPQPGGPQKIELVKRSASIARRKSLPGPTIWL